MPNLHEHVKAQQPSLSPCALAFVGEAPGDTEVCRGVPLCGPSGVLFNTMLGEAGIDRKACYVGNVFDEQLPQNDLAQWGQKEETTYRMPKGGFLPEDKHWHFQRLEDELACAQPAVIVPMGVTALWAFTGITKITESRGSVMRATRICPGAKIIPTFHPSFVLRQFKMKGTVVGDMRKALTESAGALETLILSKRNLILEPSLLEIADFCREVLQPSPGPFALDIETAKGQITHFGVAADAERAICIPFVDFRKPDRSYWTDWESEAKAWQAVEWICDLPQPKTFQNGPYDCFYLLRAGIPVRNYRDDTRLREHALNPEEPKSLAYLGAKYCNLGPFKLLADHAKAKDEEKRDA